MDVKAAAKDFVGSFLVSYGAFTTLIYAGAAGNLIGLGAGAAMNISSQLTGGILTNSLLTAAGFTIIRLKMK